MLKKYLNTLNELNQAAIRLEGKDELINFSLSDTRWAQDRFKERKKHKFLKGEIYQFEFGKNYLPEISYEHRGLIIGVSGKLLYVLPIYSYDATKEAHKNAYHPINNPDKKQNLFLLKASEFDFVKHDSVLKLNDLRSISVNRMQYTHSYRMDINGDAYKEIENLVIQKYFNQFHYEHSKLVSDYEVLKNEYEKIKLENDSFKEKINELGAVHETGHKAR